MPPLTGTVQLRGVSKHFGSAKAVDDVSLRLDPGLFYSLLGPSGCGKTTTLRLIAGFEQPTAGDILLNGERVNERPPYQRDVSTVFQSYALFPHLTVERNVAFGLEQQRKSNIEPLVNEALEMVQLSDKRKRYPAQLSGGEKQRVALARSLVLKPSVLLLDEPLSALDVQLRRLMRAGLRELQQRTGITFLLVTHDQEEALALSDQIVILNQGRIEQQGAPHDVYRKPATRFAADFLGAMNWIGDIGIRPEFLRVSTNGEGRRARVTGSAFLGNLVQLHLLLETGENIMAEILGAAPEGQLNPSDEVRVGWSTQDEIRVPAPAARKPDPVELR
ncbi:ABC transporter ATP-binding protein [Nevskia soli]|uniref:ABC transporter ATP-binding protein n=1 Tax=Nevskia soli TaxID=418856 RepID=UPI0015D90D69|nr:ABC transporter ATP-binding protein [Nevskia soli]